MRCHNYTCIEVKWRFTVYTIQVLRVFNLLLLPDILNKDIQNSTHSPPNFWIIKNYLMIPFRNYLCHLCGFPFYFCWKVLLLLFKYNFNYLFWSNVILLYFIFWWKLSYFIMYVTKHLSSKSTALSQSFILILKNMWWLKDYSFFR